MINATDRTYKLECYREKNDTHYHFNFRRYSRNRWEMTLQEGSEVPENEKLAYFIDELFAKTWECLPGERILDITVLSVDKKNSVYIDTCEHHPCSEPGQFRTGQQNVLEILQAHDFKMC